MANARDIIDAARTWIDTPFVHQGRAKGVGVDCANFIAEVALEAGAVTDVEFERDYRRHENGATMLRLLRGWLDYVPNESQARPGDVVALCDELCRDPQTPRHVAILTQTEPYWKAIHASQRGVREHRFDKRFRQRTHSVWRVRGLDDD